MDATLHQPGAAVQQFYIAKKPGDRARLLRYAGKRLIENGNSMIRLTYVSTSRPTTGEEAIAAILDSSRRNNRAAALTGLLIFDGKRFLQALEGEEDQVLAAFARIRADDRHFACVELERKPIAERAFGDWDMAWRHVGEADEGATLGELVERLVAGVPDPSIRAHFSGFARVHQSRY